MSNRNSPKGSKKSQQRTVAAGKGGRRSRKDAGDTGAKVTRAGSRKPDSTDGKKSKRISGLDLAAEVLAKSGKPLNAKTIAERVIAAGWKTDGKTPHATLYSAIIREITTKKNASRFRKTDRGQFVATKGAM